MKKSICLILSILLLLSFTACGEETVSSTVSSVSNTPLPEGAGNYKVDDFKYQVQEDGTVFVKYVGKDSEVVFPDEINGYKVTGIQASACMNNKTLKKITIPSSVKTIQSEAFKGCTALKIVVLNEGITIIRGSAFNGCTAIENITFPESLTEIGMKAFYGCISLKDIHITKNIKILADGAFEKTGIKSVTFENGIETIDSNVFLATNLTEITLPKTVKTLGYNALGSNKNLIKINLNEGLETIETQAFAYCPKLTEIVIPETVENITEFTFDMLTSIEKVKFEGDAPENYIDPESKIKVYTSDYTVYYHKGAKGFTSPTWNGYKTEIW